MSEVFLIGGRGRMGKELQFIIEANDSLEVTKEITGKTKLIIDFSSPEGFRQAVELAKKNKLPLVSGTTGLGREDFALLEKAAGEIPVLWAANMSLGVAVVTEMLKNFKFLSSFDFKIEETHHIHKKDNPSGTAILFQKSLEGAIGKTIPTPIGTREAEVLGKHKVTASSEEESIILEHRAMKRRVFARGAIRAGEWLLGQRPGLYSLRDVIGLGQ